LQSISKKYLNFVKKVSESILKMGVALLHTISGSQIFLNGS